MVQATNSMEAPAQFLILSTIGRGEIATLYLAVNEHTGQQVALKVLRPNSPVPNALSYFRNEVEILSELYHPNIPGYLDCFEEPEPTIVMDYIDGHDGEWQLSQLKENQFIPETEIITWGLQLCDVLHYLHTHKPTLIYRDLKPAHIMIDHGHRIWLVDYNLTKALPENAAAVESDAVGTEGYAAPEQYCGVISPLIDIYALGATLHYFVTRIDPHKERRFTYAPPRSMNPTLSKAFSDVIMKALAYEPEQRYQSASEMAEALQACLISTAGTGR